MAKGKNLCWEGGQIYSRKCDIFVNNIVIVAAACVYIKHVSGFKWSENTSLKILVMKMCFHIDF